MLKFLLAAAILGSAGGAGGGTIVAHLHKPAEKAPLVQIALKKPGKKNRLTMPGVGLAAGDRLQRPFDLKNKGTAGITGIALTTTASPSSLLDTDPVNGLQLRIDRCPKAWKYDKVEKEYTCRKPIIGVIAPRAVIGSNVAIAGLADVQAMKKRTAHLMLTLTLPSSAPNTLQGRSSSLTYTFTAVQGGPRV